MSNKKKNSAKADDGGQKIIEANKKARHDYEIIDTFEAGIELLGCEVKSIRSGGISLRDSYIRFKNGQCYLVACHISPYRYSRREEVDPYRDRRLLLHGKEIGRMASQVQKKGLTAVPLKVYFNKKGRCKLELALGKGKKVYDKRQDLKRKDAKREIERALKG